jgi:hypothetical protein
MAELSPERAAIVAKAKETRERNKALRTELITEMSGTSDIQIPSVMSDETLFFIEGLKLGISNLDIRSPSELSRAIPFAKEFAKIVKENA